MDADEPYLRPCKQLPSPTNDRQASHMPMGQHLGIQSSSQGHVDQDSRDTSPAVDEGDSEDEAFEFQQGFSNDASDHATLQSSEDNTVQLLKGKDTERIVIAQRNGPLRLLDLPLDILKLILKEVCPSL